MKALSLWQPWASLIPLGMKTVETRHWKTSYRGDLLICAAKKNTKAQEEWFNSVIFPLNTRLSYEQFPFGVAVAKVTMVDCLLMTQDLIDSQSKIEQACGLWEVGRYAWIFNNIRPTSHFRVMGKQGLFKVN
ncbi:ASCH domain-containing protein [Anabaena sp. CCY 0017]|uniref:ASCH domain-containing protein n=1 Tax=Anabaena sp. CCY 0017 TaxID=3103866 RepID=UPI0039C67D1B